MSSDNNLWMGDIQPWMNESFILNSFKYYNIHPLNVKLIHDRNTNELKNFCFINFENIEEANKCVLNLNGKPIPNTDIKFKLNWANYYSTFNKSVYVGNLSPDVDDISLYNLFKSKYSSVHHASVITDKGKSKGFGFILFRGEKDYERCLSEMDGIIFHGNAIKVNEQRKKDDENKKNSNENNDNFIYNFHYNSIRKQNNNNGINNNLEQSPLNNRFNNMSQINKIKNINNNGTNIQPNNIGNINNNSNNNMYYQSEKNPYINQNKYNQNIINNIININNINRINNINYINDINNIYNKNQMNNNNNFILNKNNINSINDNSKNNFSISNHNHLFYLKNNFSKESNDNSSFHSFKDNSKIKLNNNINNTNNFNKANKKKKKKKKNNSPEYELEIFNKYDNITLKRRIRENLDKMYKYYMEVYPGDINKLRCKFYFFNLILIILIVSNMFIYHCNSENQLKLFSCHNNNDTFIV